MDQGNIITALQAPALYPHNPPQVEVIQTHISYILLAGNEVYKVKKPVNFGFLDFTTLERRKYYCEEEVRLNRRLAPTVYLEVVPITVNKEGVIALKGEGEVVEYAVRMKRLPEERMLRKLIEAHDFDPDIFTALAQRVGDFHRQAATGGDIDAMGDPQVIRYNHEENFTQTQPYLGRTITEEQYQTITGWVERFFQDHHELLVRRVADHHIRDGHGDLHLEHICVTDEIIIFDCIEFNERFRYADVAAEVAFLAMDLDFHGYPAFSRRFTEAYVTYTGDNDVDRLHNFYKCYYAYVRGKVVSFRLDDPHISRPDRDAAHDLAQRYFRLAYRYVTTTARPILIVMAGLTGTGKSVLARELNRRLGATLIQTDVIRKEIAGLNPTTHRYEEAGQGIYRPEMSARTYTEARQRTRELLLAGKSVILDATHTRLAERQAAYDLAREIGVACYLVYCTCPEDVVVERLHHRMGKEGEVSDGRWEIYLHQRDQLEPPQRSEPFITVDTSQLQEETMNKLFRAMGLR